MTNLKPITNPLVPALAYATWSWTLKGPVRNVFKLSIPPGALVKLNPKLLK